MVRRITALIVVMAFSVVFFGCASVPEEHKGAATGAGIGAAAGVVAGALLGSEGSKTEMAILGGLVGALAGGLIGHYGFDQKKTKEQTETQYKYTPSKGTFVTIEDVSVKPDTVKPGERVDIDVTYAVLGAPGGKMDISEVREIKFDNQVVGKPQVNVSRADGTYSSTIPLTLPTNAQKGKYTVVTTVQSAAASDVKMSSFTVK